MAFRLTSYLQLCPPTKHTHTCSRFTHCCAVLWCAPGSLGVLRWAAHVRHGHDGVEARRGHRRVHALLLQVQPHPTEGTDHRAGVCFTSNTSAVLTYATKDGVWRGLGGGVRARARARACVHVCTCACVAWCIERVGLGTALVVCVCPWCVPLPLMRLGCSTIAGTAVASSVTSAPAKRRPSSF